jgi:thioredoxin reductase
MSAAGERAVDLLIVGAGPSGLSLAGELARRRVGRVEVLEREQQAGGIPRHSHHTGFGVRDLHRIMSGPRYATRLIESAQDAGARVRTGVAAVDWSGELGLVTTSAEGRECIRARAIVLATGARERTRPARMIPGDRGAGIYTTGQLQQAVYGFGQRVGARAVVVGAEHVSHSAVVTLSHAGVRVVAMITDLPRQQSYTALHLAARARYRFPVVTASRLLRIIARRGRVQAVEVEHSGQTVRISCDTLVLTGHWIADNELARRGGLAMVGPSGAPRFDQSHATSRPGVFAIGNLTHPVQTADVVAREAVAAGRHILSYLDGGEIRSLCRLAVHAGAGLGWVAPNVLTIGGAAPHRNQVTVWTTSNTARPIWTVRQGDAVLWCRARRATVANRPIHLPAPWLTDVDPAGPQITIDLATR